VVQAIGGELPIHADFGARAGYEVAVLTKDEPVTNLQVGDYAAESDSGPYRIPDSTPIEAGDHHALVLDAFRCQLYELFGAQHPGPGQWSATAAAIFDLRTNQLRPAQWTSADGAGLPVIPGLAKYEEVKTGRIGHALRFTVPNTRNLYVWPARHAASNKADPVLPPMGARFRLKSSFDVTRFSPETRVILEALQEYGMMLADNGSAWYVSGTMDRRWPSKVHEEMRLLHGSDFEVVDASTLRVNLNSAQARQ
jgi:hypothetical protein